MAESATKSGRWRFPIRALFHLTAFVAAAAGSYRINAYIGFVLTVPLAVFYGTYWLQRYGNDEAARNGNGIVGAMLGGALAAAGHPLIVGIRAALGAFQESGQMACEILAATAIAVPYALMLGAIIGSLIWHAWRVLDLVIRKIGARYQLRFLWLGWNGNRPVAPEQVGDWFDGPDDRT